MRIIAYTYDADVHCPHCAKVFAEKQLAGIKLPAYTLPAHPAPGVSSLSEMTARDTNGVPEYFSDSEGNEGHPVFDIDEDIDGVFTHCSDCHEELT